MDGEGKFRLFGCDAALLFEQRFMLVRQIEADLGGVAYFDSVRLKSRANLADLHLHHGVGVSALPAAFSLDDLGKNPVETDLVLKQVAQEQRSQARQSVTREEAECDRVIPSRRHAALENDVLKRLQAMLVILHGLQALLDLPKIQAHPRTPMAPLFVLAAIPSFTYNVAERQRQCRKMLVW